MAKWKIILVTLFPLSWIRNVKDLQGKNNHVRETDNASIRETNVIRDVAKFSSEFTFGIKFT